MRAFVWGQLPETNVEGPGGILESEGQWMSVGVECRCEGGSI